VTLQQLPATTETVLHRTPIGGLDLSIHRDASAITVVIHDPGTATDAERLGRELRGTIEELIQARRTLELQRTEIERAATVDPLTGVASRGAILERLQVEVEQARRYQHPVAVVLLDVDSFGEINSLHGIEGGDAVLREIALRVRLRVRAADAIGRSGSDGLLAILPHTDESGAATFADALRRRISQRPVSIGEVEVGVTLSIGVAVMRPGEDLDVDALMARAEEALSSARGAGGNRIALDRLHGLARLEEKPASVRDRLSLADDEALDEGA
jgi:diguanylate cyclase (GGDEF)-like protein